MYAHFVKWKNVFKFKSKYPKFSILINTIFFYPFLPCPFQPDYATAGKIAIVQKVSPDWIDS